MIRMFFALTCLVPTAALAQGTGSAKARAALAPFQRLVGVWEGDAHVTLIPGAPVQVVRQREQIALGAGGTTMTVNMAARAQHGPQKGHVIYQASGPVGYDEHEGKLGMKARQAADDPVEVTIEVKHETKMW